MDTMHVNPEGQAIPAPVKCPNVHPIKGTPCEFSLGHSPAKPGKNCVSVLKVQFRGTSMYRNYYFNPKD